MYREITGGVVGGTEQAQSGYKKREGRPGWVPGGFLPAAGPMQAERRAWPMTAGQSPGGGNLRRMAGKNGDI